MIYQDTKRFLKRHLVRPKKDYEWGSKDNILLLELLENRYSEKEIHNNLSEIKQAFRDFFEPIGNIVIRFKEDKGVAYKVLPYYVEPKSSKHLEKIVNIIRSDLDAIEYPYKGRNDQVALLGKIRRHINAEIIETDEAVNKKELIRHAIKIALELDKKDVVLHFKRRYIVKLFKKNDFLNRVVGEPESKDDSERRFQGYSAEELSAHYNELIEDIDLEAFLDNVMATLFAGKLNFELINNDYYEKNVLFLVRNEIANELKDYISENDDYLLGFAGYIFRNNFESVHERMAIEIFELFTKKSENAANFLSYYTGEIHLEGGKKYAIPELMTEDGKHWNIPAVTSVASIWLRARDEKDKCRVKIENISSEFDSLEKEYEQISSKLKSSTKELIALKDEENKIDSIIYDIRKSHEMELEGKQNKKSEIKISRLLKEEEQKLFQIRDKIIKALKIKNEFQKKEKEKKSKYIEYKSRKQKYEAELKNLTQSLDINSSAFHSILSSLVKALMKRKKLIEDKS